jgi:hypothetical protein
MRSTFATALTALALAACSSTSTSFTTEAAVAGPADAHCAGKPAQPTDQAVCKMMGTADGDYGATLPNAEGDDDDCKYHLSWSSTEVAEKQDVTFRVVVTKKTDGSPALSAATEAEVFLSDLHPAPATAQKTTEDPPGTYAIGPIQFDAPGKWTVRFHLYEECTDVSEESPHGHAAFYVEVP